MKLKLILVSTVSSLLSLIAISGAAYATTSYTSTNVYYLTDATTHQTILHLSITNTGTTALGNIYIEQLGDGTLGTPSTTGYTWNSSIGRLQGGTVATGATQNVIVPFTNASFPYDANYGFYPQGGTYTSYTQHVTGAYTIPVAHVSSFLTPNGKTTAEAISDVATNVSKPIQDNIYIVLGVLAFALGLVFIISKLSKPEFTLKGVDSSGIGSGRTKY